MSSVYLLGEDSGEAQAPWEMSAVLWVGFLEAWEWCEVKDIGRQEAGYKGARGHHKRNKNCTSPILSREDWFREEIACPCVVLLDIHFQWLKSTQDDGQNTWTSNAGREPRDCCGMDSHVGGQAPQVPGNSVAEFVEELKTFLPENTQSLGWCTACFALDLGPRAKTVALTGHLVCLMNASWRTFTSSLWCFAFELQPCQVGYNYI